MDKRPHFFALFVASTICFAPASAADYFWSSRDECSARVLQIQRIREGLKAGLIELRLGKLGHSTVETKPGWKSPDEVESTTFQGIDAMIQDIELICELRYPN